MVVNMKEVCVITGGGNGMGLETARIMGKTHYGTMGTDLIILIEFKAQILYVTLKLSDLRISSVKRFYR